MHERYHTPHAEENYGPEMCPMCYGSGNQVTMKTCPDCNGSGTASGGDIPCQTCEGSGKVVKSKKTCTNCGGHGVVE